MAVLIGVWGMRMPPLVQVGVLALGMVGLVVLSVRSAEPS
jgi:hypothetical protein